MTRRITTGFLVWAVGTLTAAWVAKVASQPFPDNLTNPPPQTVNGFQSQLASVAETREIELPFTLNDQGNIVVSAVLNRTDRLRLMLHTAATDVVLTEDAVRKASSLKFTGTDKVKSWGGESDSRVSTGNEVQIGDLLRRQVSIWEDKNSGQETDGKFGLDYFEHGIVEVDFDHGRLVIHQKLPRKARTGGCVNIEGEKGLLLIQGICLIEEQRCTNSFLIHSGYSGGILWDDAFAAKVGIEGKITITEESSLKDSFGNTIKVKKGILPGFVLGGTKITNVPAGFFAGAIGAQKMSIIGTGVLTRFNLIFDLANKDLYFFPRSTGASPAVKSR